MGDHLLSGIRWGLVILLGLFVGVAGWMSMNTAWHLWEDHTRLHQLYELELRRAQAQQAAPVASPPPVQAPR